MWERVKARIDELARRAGLSGTPPAAVAAVAVLLGMVVVVALWRWWPRGETTAMAPVARASASAAEATTSPSALKAGTSESRLQTGGSNSSASSPVTVHVVGAVLHPGVYELRAGSRVRDAVDAAGGLAGNAAQEAVNLARPLADGEQIVVATRDEYAKAGTSGGTASGSGAGGGVASRGGASAENPGAPSPGAVVNINTADAAALDALPGVGPSTAAKIVADREANGPFASPDDLGRVSGIGPKKLEELKGFISVR